MISKILWLMECDLNWWHQVILMLILFTQPFEDTNHGSVLHIVRTQGHVFTLTNNTNVYSSCNAWRNKDPIKTWQSLVLTCCTVQFLSTGYKAVNIQWIQACDLHYWLMLLFQLIFHCNNKNKVNTHAKHYTLFGIIVTCNIIVPCWNTQF